MTTPSDRAPRTTHRCPDCGHEMYFEITSATVDCAFVIGCPGCGTAMDRLDPLGLVERELRGNVEPVRDVLAEARRRYA